MIGKFLAFPLMIFAISACEQKQNSSYEEEAYVFGTVVKFTIKDVPEETARQAVKDAAQEFQKMHNEWNAWKPGELTRINRSIAKGEQIQVSDFVLPVIKQSKEFYQSSEGLFNPAIGKLIETWGFHHDEIPQGTLPSFEVINELVNQSPGMDNVILNGNYLSSTNHLVQFDFGGFGKGVALDRAEEIFKRHGIRNAIINAGGDVNTMGTPGLRPWKVAIRHPVHWGAIASLELTAGEDLYTSGNYERFIESEGIRYAHIIDPRNGMPIDHIVSASVIHDNGALADAAATALAIAGPEEWQHIAQNMGVKYVLLIDDKGAVYLNPAMYDRISFESDDVTEIVISNPIILENESGV